jgi:hypothetical protein
VTNPVAGQVLRFIGAFLFLVGAGMPNARAQVADEASVKAVFLFRFGAFVDWPPNAFQSASTPLAICIADAPGLAEGVRRAAAGQAINGRPVIVHTGAAGAGCHILYLGGSRAAVSEGLRLAGARPVLTVTDESNASLRGDIHFVIVDNRVRFHIDRSDTDRKGLRLNSRLLSIALSTGGGQQ